VNTIQGTLAVTGGGSDTMNIDDSGTTGAKTGTLTATALTGLGMGPGGITHSGLSQLHITRGSGGGGGNTPGTAAGTTTTIDPGGSNTYNVGSQRPATGGVVNTIQGALIFVSGSGDTLNIDDTGDGTAQSGTLTPTTLTGLGMGPGGITYAALASL